MNRTISDNTRPLLLSNKGRSAQCRRIYARSSILFGLLLLTAAPTWSQQATNEASSNSSEAEVSVAHAWVDAALFAIRNDFARPTVHARNLYHLSATMYEAWAKYDDEALPLWIHPRAALESCRASKTRKSLGKPNTSTSADTTENTEKARRLAIGHAAWHLLRERYRSAKNSRAILAEFSRVAAAQGLGIERAGDALARGRRAAECVLAIGRADASNERDNFANLDYIPFNAPLDPTRAGNPSMADPNRWQPLSFDNFIDQSGNDADASEFLGAEWGRLEPFALKRRVRSVFERNGANFPIWLDPGSPPQHGFSEVESELYAKNFALVAMWSAHLDPDDGVMLDISPGVIGNTYQHADRIEDPRLQLNAYDAFNGGMPAATGHPVNPVSGVPYAPNVVPRGDYTRVLAEFWADGPDSETPPGHWFRIYNEKVGNHPLLTRRVGGRGEVLSALDFDVLAYLALGGAMHDSAIAAWSVKGAYDYPRPVSAIRYLASLGTKSGALPLIKGRIERIGPADLMVGKDYENFGKIKVLAWRGPDAISDPQQDTAGVGWILAERWWPYQRPSFVTPPFAGYVSGHSAFSRAAAEVLERLTGDAFFPGGLAEFHAPANEFLVFERGPSVDVTLQWATYRDAADQTALSRIWGGIHPPVDDLPGRRLGAEVGVRAWERALALFDGGMDPNPAVSEVEIQQPAVVEQAVASTAGGCSSTGEKRAGLGPSWLVLLLWGAIRARARA